MAASHSWIMNDQLFSLNNKWLEVDFSICSQPDFLEICGLQ